MRGKGMSEKADKEWNEGGSWMAGLFLARRRPRHAAGVIGVAEAHQPELVSQCCDPTPLCSTMRSMHWTSSDTNYTARRDNAYIIHQASTQ